MSSRGKYLKKVPLASTGTMLAIASLGNLLDSYSTYFKSICGIVSVILFTAITLKILIYRQDFTDNIRDINVVSVFPTYFMSVMVLSTYGSVFIGSVNISAILWLLAFICHIFFAARFVKNYVLKFDVGKVLPNWFITCVAYSLVGISAPVYGLRILGQIVSVIGITCYFILFPIVIYRILVIKQIHKDMKPTIWLLNSPINICIVAYMSSFVSVNKIFILILLLFSLFSIVFSLIHIDIKQLIATGFSVTFSAFTFPTVIFVTALGRIYNFFYDNGQIKIDCSVFLMILNILCTTLVFGVFILTALYIFANQEKKHENKKV